MQRIVQNESTDGRRRVYFTAVKVDDVTDNLVTAEIGTWVVKISKNGADAAAPSGTTVSEVDSTDFPGLWYWEGNAADFDTLGVLLVRISNTSGSKVMRERSVLVHVVAADSIYVTPPVDVVKVGGTAIPTPTTAGVLRVDVKAMETGVLTNTAIASNAISSAKVADGTIDLATFAADALLGAFGILDVGTAQSGSTTGMRLRTGASAVTGAYVGATIYATGGSGALQRTTIDTYDPALKDVTFTETLGTAFSGTTTYVIVAGGGAGSGGASAAAVAAAVWAEVLEGSFTAADITRLIVSAVVAMVSGFSTGTLTFRDLLNTKNRFVAVDDENVGRTSVSILDAT